MGYSNNKTVGSLPPQFQGFGGTSFSVTYQGGHCNAFEPFTTSVYIICGANITEFYYYQDLGCVQTFLLLLPECTNKPPVNPTPAPTLAPTPAPTLPPTPPPSATCQFYWNNDVFNVPDVPMYINDGLFGYNLNLCAFSVPCQDNRTQCAVCQNTQYDVCIAYSDTFLMSNLSSSYEGASGFRVSWTGTGPCANGKFRQTSVDVVCAAQSETTGLSIVSINECTYEFKLTLNCGQPSQCLIPLAPAPIGSGIPTTISTNSEPSMALDLLHNVGEGWNGGWWSAPNKYVQYNFGQVYELAKIHLVVNQLPNCTTEHQLYGTGEELLHTFYGYTEKWQPIDYVFPRGTRTSSLKIITQQSCSNAAWFNISIDAWNPLCSVPPPPPSGVCGDGVCDYHSESCITCPLDCGACNPPTTTTTGGPLDGYCGDGNCEASRGENCQTCSTDCRCPPVTTTSPPVSVCGNGICEPLEDCVNCVDCQPCPGNTTTTAIRTGVKSTSDAHKVGLGATWALLVMLVLQLVL
eukprot:Phypoly_transcript_01994.p1 GENE.Phypoly_transcript_01994~~Phypoly_transcript_01994.p1  ORF type:complete len:520 (+),score=43.01 Phypoly_transcript_01994:1406-2965(+)